MAKILIVEDDKKIAQLEKDYLESSGYEADVIGDGTQVIPEVKKNSYDLILLDLMLPGLSGYDICRTIRDEIDIPILMVTARSEAADIIRGLGLGADDYITKPFDPSQLIARVRSHLKRYARLTSDRDTGSKNKENQDQIAVADLIIEPKTWKYGKTGERLNCLTGNLNCFVFWRKIQILFF